MHTDQEEIAALEQLDSAFEQHARHPQNMHAVPMPHGKSMGIGSCGDSVEMAIRIEGEKIVEIGHLPNGCAYTIACASAVTMLAKGKTIDEALAIQPEDVEQSLGGLPEDHKHCARLAVNTLGEAIAETCKKQKG